MYTVNGREGIDVRPFLRGVRGNITSILGNNRRTKVKLILICNMERPSILGEILVPTSKSILMERMKMSSTLR